MLSIHACYFTHTHMRITAPEAHVVGIQVIVRRGERVDNTPGAATPLGTPIIVATRNDALLGVFEATPEDRRAGDSLKSVSEQCVHMLNTLVACCNPGA